MKFMKKNLNVILFSSTELIQVYEAAKFAIQRVNAQNIVPGIRLGKPLFMTFWKKINKKKSNLMNYHFQLTETKFCNLWLTMFNICLHLV